MNVTSKDRRLWLFISMGMGMLLFVLFWVVGGRPLPVQAAATDRYVSPSGTDTGGCTSTVSPCATVQFAVDAAQAGDRILVAQGTYTDVHSRVGMTQVVYISKSLTLVGSFDDSFTHRFPRTSRLVAEGKGRVLFVSGTITVTVDGFALTTGSATAGGGTSNGGGILVYDANLQLVDNYVASNEALGGIGEGGGIYNQFGTLRVEDSFVGFNEADDSGGGLRSFGGRVHVRDTLFHLNFADSGGAIDLDTVKAWMTNTIMFENGATSYGGALSTGGSTIYMWHPSLILNYGDSGIFAGADIHGQPNTIYMTNALAVSHTVAISTILGPAPPYNDVIVNGVLWFDNQDNTGGTGRITVTNAYTGDPALGVLGFQIQAGSAAINRGVPSRVSSDYYGESRIAAPDLGADEYVIIVYLPLVVRNF